MRKTFRFLLVLLASLLLMLVFRSVGAMLLTVEGNGLSPVFIAGDRILVNRWSYGLRVGGSESLFNYGRICKQPIAKGDIVAFENPQDSPHSEILICRCKALPGDSLMIDGTMMIIPSLNNCAEADYYWLEAINPDNPVDSRSLGLIAEEHIIGRAAFIVYSHDPSTPVWSGWRTDRILLPL
ncbi:MAG: S26 family signal peptidase [Prevotella sp.]|nr:S26 family signal peptidase [Prevotella sp.]